MAEIRLSTAGIHLLYAVETTAGQRPTTGYIDIPEITEIPETSAAPENIDVTPLSATKNRIYIPGLMDTGGTLSIMANFSQQQINNWNKTLVPAYEEAIKDNRRTWFCMYIPGCDDSLYYTAIPTRFAGPGATVNSALQIALPLTPSTEFEWLPAPTDIETSIGGVTV